MLSGKQTGSGLLGPIDWPTAVGLVIAIALGATIGQEKWLQLGVLLALLFVFYWPVQVALGSFILLVPLDSGALKNAGSGKTLVWFVGAGAACTLIATALVQRRRARLPRVSIWWIAFLVWVFVTTLWALSPRESVLGMPTAAASLGLYLASVFLRIEKKEFRSLVYLTILSGCIAGLYASYEFFHHISFLNTNRGSLILDGSEVNPNVFAARLLLPLSLAIGSYFAANSRIIRILSLMSAGLLVMGVLVTMSRGALLSVLVIAAVFMFRLGINRRMVLLGVALSAALFLMPVDFFLRIGNSAMDRGAGRLDIWRVGWELLKHYGAFGAGLNNFSVAYNNYAGFAPHFEGFSRDPHNVYLRIAVEFGLVGTLLFINLMRHQLLSIRIKVQDTRAKAWIVACEAAGWSMLGAGLFSNILWEKTFWFTWIMLAFATQLYGGLTETTKHADSLPGHRTNVYASRSDAVECVP